MQALHVSADSLEPKRFWWIGLPVSGIVEEVSSRGFGTPAIQCDQQDRTAVEAVCDGAGQTHAAILNAAVNPYNDWEAEDWNESFQEIMAINVLGALSTFREPRYRPCRMAMAASC